MLLLLVCAEGVFSQEYWEWGGGAKWVVSTVADSAPDPIVFTTSLGARFVLSGDLSFRPNLSIWTTDYEWRDNPGYAIPSEHYVLASSLIHSFVLNPALAYEKELTPGTSFYLQGAPVLRIPLAAEGSETAKEEIFGYFLEKGRFLSLGLGGGYAWTFDNDVSMGLRLQVDYPLYLLWDTSAPSLLEGFSVEAGVLFRFTPGKIFGNEEKEAEGLKNEDRSERKDIVPDEE